MGCECGTMVISLSESENHFIANVWKGNLRVSRHSAKPATLGCRVGAY